MSTCKNTVTQWVKRGYDHTPVESRCGTTGQYGEMLLCETCEDAGVNTYTCPHGVDVSEREMACGQCNMENE